MPEEWERQAVLHELTERITTGEFGGNYDGLKRAIEQSGALDERDQQKLVQYWLSKERERGRG
jgi:hypothetical protein